MYIELPVFLGIKPSQKCQSTEKKFSTGQFPLSLLTSSALISSEIQGKVINGKYNNTVRILWPFYQSKRFNYKRQCSETYQSLKAFTRAQPYWIFSCSGLKLIYLLMISVSIYKWEFFSDVIAERCDNTLLYFRRNAWTAVELKKSFLPLLSNSVLGEICIWTVHLLFSTQNIQISYIVSRS